MIYIDLNCTGNLKYLHYSAVMAFENKNTLQVFLYLLVYFTVNYKLIIRSA